MAGAKVATETAIARVLEGAAGIRLRFRSVLGPKTLEIVFHGGEVRWWRVRGSGRAK